MSSRAGASGRLNELRVQGFKTFADPTRFAFQRGVTAVVGPNGSGKSNLADAVRWVLGEQSTRALRLRRAEDVIFAGSQQRRPHGLAEVVLTLDNADGWLPVEFGEVSIARRVYRSGESEYLLNGTRVRLRDVVDLLDAGRIGSGSLVVIGQGTVDAALSLRPDERRVLFEEAAGVTRLQARRSSALARLSSARDNLARVRDLIAEVKPQVRRLALQAEHQEQHDELAARLRALIVESSGRRETAARGALGAAARRSAAADAELDAFRARREAAQRELAGMVAGFWEADAASRGTAARREAAREARVRAEMRLDSLLAREQELRLALAAAERAEREAARRLAELDARGGGPDAGAGDDAGHAAESRWRAAGAAYRAAESRLLELEERLSEVRRRRARDENERWDAEESLRRAAARQADLHGELDRQRARIRELDEASRHATGIEATAAEALEQAREVERAASLELRAARSAAAESERRVTELGARLAAVRAELTATGHDAREAALAERLAAGGWSYLADALAIPDAAWRATEAVVGGRLSNALAWRDGSVLAMLTEGDGTAHLVPVDAATPAADPHQRAAAVRAVDGERTLAEWIGRDGLPAAFHATVVARDVASLLAGWRNLPPGWCAVTVEGDLADSRGIISVRGRGGRSRYPAVDERDSTSNGASVEQRRRALSRTVTEMERDASGAAEARREAEARLGAVITEHAGATNAVREANEAWQRARMEAQEATRRASAAHRDLAELDEQERAGQEAVDQARQRVERMSRPRATDGELRDLERAVADAAAARDAAAAEREAVRTVWEEHRRVQDELHARSAERRRERNALEAERAAAAATIPAQQQMASSTARERRAAEEELEHTARAEDAASIGHEEAERVRERARAVLVSAESETSGADSRLAALEGEAHAARVDLSRHEEALAAMERERALMLDAVPEPHDTDAGASATATEATASVAPSVARLADADLDQELRRVRRALAQIGSINPFAVTEHRELSARLADLSTQEADLERALSSTDTLVRQLEADIRETFSTSFRAIGERFNEFVRVLFAGGSGSLTVLEPTDGEQSGTIEIEVRPPGKRLQPSASLSGGERALAGVALLFAMLSVNPVAFCVLDEVDAALDEANIGRFVEALRRLSEGTQFVVITHNRATIEMADTIYGVTMTDAAVSRVISLRLSEIPAEQAV